jgi:hypothetical protein
MAVIWVGSLLCMAWAVLESALLHVKHNPLLQPYPSKSFPWHLVIWCVDRVVQHKMPQHDVCHDVSVMVTICGMCWAWSLGPGGTGGGGRLLQVDTFTAERYSPICVGHAMGMVWALRLRLSLLPPCCLHQGGMWMEGA